MATMNQCKCGGSYDEYDLCFECDLPKPNKETKMNTKLWLLLHEHDWAFQYTDDHHAWVKGQDEHDAIITEARRSIEDKMLFDVWAEMRRAGHIDGPPLEHRGFAITRIGSAWVITREGLDQEVDIARTPRQAVEMIDEYLDNVTPSTRAIPDNVIQFPC